MRKIKKSKIKARCGIGHYGRGTTSPRRGVCRYYQEGALARWSTVQLTQKHGACTSKKNPMQKIWDMSHTGASPHARARGNLDTIVSTSCPPRA
jgi:hypothetical protein